MRGPAPYYSNLCTVVPIVGLLGDVCGGFDRRIHSIIANVEPQACRVDATVTPEQKTSEYRLGADVENAVEDGFTVRRDHVAAFAQTPSDGVQEPEERSPGANDQEGFANVFAK